jgi:hypothetical protein
MAETTTPQEALLTLIAQAAHDANNMNDAASRTKIALYLAEAYAWTLSPNQPHGSGS